MSIHPIKEVEVQIEKGEKRVKRVFRKLRFRNLKLGAKYGLSFVVTVFLFLAASAIIYVFLNNVEGNIDALDRRGDRSVNIMQMGALFKEKNIQILKYLNNPGVGIADDYESLSEKFDQLREKIEPKMRTDKQKDLFEKIVQNDAKMNDIFTQQIIPALDYGKSEKTEKAMEQWKEADEISGYTVHLLEGLEETVDEEMQQAARTAKESITDTTMLLITAVAVAIIIGFLITFFVNRSVDKAFRKVIGTAWEISKGNLNIEEVAYKGSDEIGKLTSSINVMRSNLRDMVKRISEASEKVTSNSEELSQSAGEVSSASQQIASTMQQLSAGSESQAGSTSEAAELITNFMEQIDTETKNSESMRASSEKVLEITEQGSSLINDSVSQTEVIYNLVEDAVEKVQGLDERSKEISKLVQVIQEISEQTNLLALNAAIEAARAGEHGRGFAVVAEEVRKLAEEVSNSVTEITTIVEGIQNESQTVSTSLANGYNEVEKGAKQMKETGASFETIQNHITDMVERIQTMSQNLSNVNEKGAELTTSIENIASTSQESSAGIEQASASIQQTNSNMEEIRSSTDALSELAEGLNEAVRKFRM